MHVLQFGYRRGWPNLTTRTIVTHAVFKIVRLNGAPHNGSPQGYTAGPRGGMTIFDVDGLILRNQDQTVSRDLSNITYTWCGTQVIISDNHYRTFSDAFERYSSGMIYTGVGCNCFTPMVKALEELKSAIQAGLEETETLAAVTDIDQVLTFLLGQNFGMGTRITNQRITAGAALLFTLSIVGWLYTKRT